MKKRIIKLEELQLPRIFDNVAGNSKIYDSSSSPAARVYFIDKDQGYFLKRAAKGSLEKEVALTRYFSSKGLAQQVLDYVSDEQDWLLTAKVEGEDASSKKYLENPKKLCQTLAETMRQLHALEVDEYLVGNRTQEYLKAVEKGYQAGNFDSHYLFSHQKKMDTNATYQQVQEYSPYLEANTLIHGDFCLPNIILNNWQFQAMIDWDSAGLGDKHIDLFWAVWSLAYNLQTNRYRDYFLDCYGRENINLELLEAIAYFEVFG
ncbi:aminoglycoside 3'-phosphotransferase [Streptococcus sp. S784/96/1]|uniref:aminoglycoside 3'-phosphotransferase n=1 Tax=Streptococcus sp. S784/96/1 TaxID=2653499 RepID=UPI001389E99F|nr:aminoglycoside 3'-phosphotransferase [Streptococcus sp. S784/96/1]